MSQRLEKIFVINITTSSVYQKASACVRENVCVCVSEGVCEREKERVSGGACARAKKSEQMIVREK